MDPQPIGGRYQIDKLIGQGGIADIYQATDLILGQPVALKMARPDDPSGADAIKREFQFLAAHPHPAIIPVMGLIYYRELPVMVMSLLEHPEIDGLDRYVGKLKFPNVDGVAAIDLIAEILECAAFIHFGNHIYNDFKPANFILRRSADNPSTPLTPILLDFNLISKIGDMPSKRGTLEYTAPEVLKGQTPIPASDLYSIGIMLYELFTGQPPFTSGRCSNLIKEITEMGEIDFSAVPPEIRDGLTRVLSRQTEIRPQNAREAAVLLGVESRFMKLARARVNHYFSSGEIPFAAELNKRTSDYLSGKLEKIFVIRGLGVDSSDINHLVAHLTFSGLNVDRLSSTFDDNAVDKLLDYLLNTPSDCDSPGFVLVIDDIAGMSPAHRQKLRALIRPPKSLPIITAIPRWTDCGFSCCQVFDPLSDHTTLNSTRIVASAYLKTAEPLLDWAGLSEITGGDPELLFHHLRQAVSSGHYDPIFGAGESSWPSRELPLTSVEEPVSRMYASAGDSRQPVLLLLSVWGNSVPLVLLMELAEGHREVVDSLVESGHLTREKDALAFPSGDARRYLYSLLTNREKREAHHFWAQAAEKHLAATDEILEISAYHWGESDDPVKGYDANLAAARELFAKGQLARASACAEKLLALADLGGGSRYTALMIYADIMKQAGEYQTARQYYIELLSLLNREKNPVLKAETFKDLGDLYRSLKRPRQALYYTRRALEYFNNLQNEQGMANCHNNIGLIHWVEQQFERALASFASALAINQKLGNFLEQAKIQSNIGIIKDIMGKTPEVAGHFETALTNAQKASDPWLEALIGNNLGYFYIRQNELARAHRQLETAAQLSERIGYTESLINCQANLGLCFLRMGDLFQSIEYNQRAVQMAESVGNRHLAADSELYLAEVCILMGNFALADTVLHALEADNIYTDNDNLRNHAKLLRSDYYRSLKQFDLAVGLADEVLLYAKGVGDTRLRLESQLCKNLAVLDIHPEMALQGFAEVVAEAENIGHRDIAHLAGLGMAKGYFVNNDQFNFAGWLEKILSSPASAGKIIIEARALQGELKILERKFDEAISILVELETRAAGYGFILWALEAALRLSEIYLFCGKFSRAREVSHRAWTYADRITASLPADITAREFTRSPIFDRLLKLKKAVADKEYMRI